jgi:hypothetical protein
LAPGENRNAKGNSILYNFTIISFPLFITIIYLLYIFLDEYISKYIPEILNFNNNKINIEKLNFFKYSVNESIQYLKIYDFLLSLLFIFMIPYFFIYSKFVLQDRKTKIRTYLYIRKFRKITFLLYFIFWNLLLIFSIFFIGVYFLYYLTNFDLKLMQTGHIKIFIFYRILYCNFSILFTFLFFLLFTNTVY